MDVNAGERPAVPPDHESSWSDGYVILLERLAALRGIDPDSAGTALSEHARHETPGTWDKTWQDRLERSMPALGYRAFSSWLSPSEVGGALGPGQPMVSFRRTQKNPRGWTLLLDRRGGRVLRANLDSRGSSDWIDVRELAQDLEVRDDDTPESLAERVQAVERRLVPAAVRLFAESKLTIEGRWVRVEG